MVFQQDKSKLVCLSFCRILALASMLGQAFWQQGKDGISKHSPAARVGPPSATTAASSAASLHFPPLTQVFYL